MATETGATRRGTAVAHPRQRAMVPARLWTGVLLAAWLVAAVVLDGWAHHRHLAHTLAPRTERRGPPSVALGLPAARVPLHLPYFLGLGAVAVLTAGRLARLGGPGRGSAGRAVQELGQESLPAVGLLLVLGGVTGTLLRPGPFRGPSPLTIDEPLTPLLHPFQVLHAAGLGLILLDPLRRAWCAPAGRRRPRDAFPAVLSLGLFLFLVGYMVQYAHPVVEPLAAGVSYGTLGTPSRYGVGAHIYGLGVLGYLVQSVSLTGGLLLLLRRWPRLPSGAVTLLLTLSAVPLSLLRGTVVLVPGILLAGLAGDRLVDRLGGGQGGPDSGQVRLVAALVPAATALASFLTLAVLQGARGHGSRGVVGLSDLFPASRVAWSADLWVGVTVLCGVAGWLVSYLVFPPRLPEGAGGAGA